MIAQLNGTPAALGPNWVVLDVHGVGFRLTCTPATVASLRAGEQTSLATTLVVREDSLSLFGFATDTERDTFELLQLASGVGPKLALAVLSVLTPGQVVQAIQTESISTLTKVPGIGRKGAEKMIIELRDRVTALGIEPGDQPTAEPRQTEERWREQVAGGCRTRLVSPGRRGRARQRRPPGCRRPQVSLGRLMKAALQSLART